MQSDAARVFAAVDPKIDTTHVDFFGATSQTRVAPRVSRADFL
jgi:hypothetical protein